MKKFLSDMLWEPLQKLWQDFYAIMDNLFAMVFILLVGWILSHAVRWALTGFLRLVHFDRFAYRVGLTQAIARAGIRREPARVLSVVVYYFLFFGFLLLGLRALESLAINIFISQIFTYLPRLAAALLLLFAGYVISAFVNRTVLIAAVNANWQFARALAGAAQGLVLVFFLAIGLEQAGIGQGIVVATFSILFGGAVLALALAFGLGGRDFARDALQRRFGKQGKRSKRKLEKDEISYL